MMLGRRLSDVNVDSISDQKIRNCSQTQSVLLLLGNIYFATLCHLPRRRRPTHSPFPIKVRNFLTLTSHICALVLFKTLSKR